MKALIQKIYRFSPSHILFFLFVFFLPFQKRYYKLLKGFSKTIFSNQSFPSYFLDNLLDFYAIELCMIGILLLSLREIFWKKSGKYLTAFLGISFLSVLFSERSTHLWPYYQWLQLVLPLLLFFALYEKLDTKKILPICFWMIFILSLLQGVIATTQYALQHSIGLKFLGEPNFKYSAVFTSTQRWLFDPPFLLKKLIRPPGTFNHPNILGGFMGIALFASSFLFLQIQNSWKKIFMGIGICFQIFTLFLTFSRGALFGFLGGCILFFSYIFLQRKSSGKNLLCYILVGILLSGVFLQPAIWRRGGIINYNKTSRNSDKPRKIYHKVALTLAASRPFTGHGWNQSLLKGKPPENEKLPNSMLKVHNVYLLILAETGILGLFAFLGFFISLFWQGWKKGLTLERVTLMTILLFILWFGCVDHYWITTSQGRGMLFLIAILLASAKERPQEKILVH